MFYFKNSKNGIRCNLSLTVPKVCPKFVRNIKRHLKISKDIKEGIAWKNRRFQAKSFIFCAFVLSMAAYTR